MNVPGVFLIQSTEARVKPSFAHVGTQAEVEFVGLLKRVGHLKILEQLALGLG